MKKLIYIIIGLLAIALFSEACYATLLRSWTKNNVPLPRGDTKINTTGMTFPSDDGGFICDVQVTDLDLTNATGTGRYIFQIKHQSGARIGAVVTNLTGDLRDGFRVRAGYQDHLGNPIQWGELNNAEVDDTKGWLDPLLDIRFMIYKITATDNWEMGVYVRNQSSSGAAWKHLGTVTTDFTNGYGVFENSDMYMTLDQFSGGTAGAVIKIFTETIEDLHTE